jgi:hypothetical protein
MGFFSGGKTTSTSDSYSGFSRPQLYDQLTSTGKAAGGDYSFLSNAGRDYFNSPMPTLNPNGFFDAQTAGVNELARQMFGNVSGDYASRGLLTPDNLGGVVGSAVTAAAPNLMSLIASNIQQQEAMKANRFQPLLNTLSTAPSLLGQENHSTYTQTAPGIGYTFGSNLASSLGQGLGSSVFSGAGGKLAMPF